MWILAGSAGARKRARGGSVSECHAAVAAAHVHSTALAGLQRVHLGSGIRVELAGGHAGRILVTAAPTSAAAATPAISPAAPTTAAAAALPPEVSLPLWQGMRVDYSKVELALCGGVVDTLVCARWRGLCWRTPLAAAGLRLLRRFASLCWLLLLLLPALSGRGSLWIAIRLLTSAGICTRQGCSTD